MGDEVMIKRPFTKSKSDTKFEELTGTVTDVNHSKVKVSTPTRGVIERHKNQVEKYTRKSVPPEEEANGSTNEEASPREDSHVSSTDVPPPQEGRTSSSGRPTRSRVPPV